MQPEHAVTCIANEFAEMLPLIHGRSGSNFYERCHRHALTCSRLCLWRGGTWTAAYAPSATPGSMTIYTRFAAFCQGISDFDGGLFRLPASVRRLPWTPSRGCCWRRQTLQLLMMPQTSAAPDPLHSRTGKSYASTGHGRWNAFVLKTGTCGIHVCYTRLQSEQSCIGSIGE